jgi:hypothetical protein
MGHQRVTPTLPLHERMVLAIRSFFFVGDPQEHATQSPDTVSPDLVRLIRRWRLTAGLEVCATLRLGNIRGYRADRGEAFPGRPGQEMGGK